MLAKFIQKVLKNTVKFDSKLSVYHYAEPLYPDIVKYLYDESITAKTGVTMLSSYLLGSGFGELDKLDISTQFTLLDFGKKLTDSVAKYNGAFILVGYDPMTLKIDELDVLPFNHARLGKEDDSGYKGKIVLCKDWSNPKDTRKYDVFNPISEVIKEQIRVQGIEKYKGQIYYLNFDYNEYYPKATIHPAIRDAKSEINASIYRDSMSENGYLGQTFIITPPFVSEKDEQGTEIFNRNNSQRDEFRSSVRKGLGSDGTQGVTFVELEYDNEDDLDKKMLIKQVAPVYDDKLFEYTEKTVEKNIIRAFDNIPLDLYMQSTGLFSASGEALIQLQLQYQNNTKVKRELIEQCLNELWKNHKNYKGENIQILPLIKEIEAEVTDENIKAQAVLRGSVGGVTALLEIQRSVASGLTDRNSAITIIVEIFGFDEITAGRMLGDIQEGEKITEPTLP